MDMPMTFLALVAYHRYFPRVEMQGGTRHKSQAMAYVKGGQLEERMI